MTTHRIDSAHALLETVQASLMRHPLFLRRQLTLSLTDGLLTISGQVTSYYEKQMAQEALRNLLGNQQMLNELTVVPEGAY